MRAFWVIAASLTATAFQGAVSAQHAEQSADLEITRVNLFNSGVGLFEATGTVSGSAKAELRFRTDQINDILKSLVVQDFSGGSVGIVSYASRDPIEKTLRSFGVDITGKPTLGQLLDQLRGEPVEVTGVATAQGVQNVTGIILGVEKKQVPAGDTTVQTEMLNLLTDGGMMQIDLAQIRGIQLKNDKVAEELRKALATLAASHDADKKSVELRFNGTGERNIRAAYLLETPVWKTSYRLVLREDETPQIQGWATVENTTEEDWNDVRLSLVSGRPISFRMDLYTPLYVPRPLEQLELYASLRPPSYAGAMEGLEDKDHDGAYSQEAFAPARTRSRADMVARDRKLATGLVMPEVRYEDSPEIELASSGVATLANAQEAGELFEYRIDTPVSIPRQHSAMLPILNGEIEAKKVSIYNPATHAKHPLNGLELTNSTGLNLMQGPVTVFDGGTYAGDAKLPDLSPKEERLVAYALDLSTEVQMEQKPTVDQMMSLRIAKGTLIHQHKYVDSRVYAIKNKAGKARTVIVEQPYDSSWTLVEPKEPSEKTENLLRFRVDVAAEKSEKLAVALERYGDTTISLGDVGLNQIRYYLRAPVITPAVKQALERVVAYRMELERLERDQQAAEQALKEAQDEQQRIRDNIRALPENTEQYARQLRQFDEAETRIADMKEKVEAARREAEAKRREMEEYLHSLTIEA
ncbi:MAG: DUF4139 domain-containing protein [Phycisphaerae bacterium]